jgi:tRNA 2-thiouridine synthesizing protein E
MFTLECNTRPYRLDDAGFLIDREEWNEDLAAALASMVGIDALSAVQLDIIVFLRECFLRHKVFPIINTVCRIDPQSEECANEQFIDPERVWKICGLERLDGVRFLEQCGKHSAIEPAAIEGPST